MSDEVLLTNYFDCLDQELSKWKARANRLVFTQAKEAILSAQQSGARIHVTGIGKPSHVAQYIASLFSSTGSPCYVLDGTEAVHGSSGQVVPGDIVIAISNSGETAELKATVETLRNNGAYLIAVTGQMHSWLAQNSELCLFAGVEQEGDSLNKPPRMSIIAEILTLQVLSLLLQEAKGLQPEEYMKWHPGGSLGKTLRKELSHE